MNVIGIGGLLLICAYGGLVVYAYYHDCDPIKARQVAKKDQIFPLFVMQVMGDIPGVPGTSESRLELDLDLDSGIGLWTRTYSDLDLDCDNVQIKMFYNLSQI